MWKLLLVLYITSWISTYAKQKHLGYKKKQDQSKAVIKWLHVQPKVYQAKNTKTFNCYLTSCQNLLINFGDYT